MVYEVDVINVSIPCTIHENENETEIYLCTLYSVLRTSYNTVH
jgi:hypothetical protein